MSGTVVVSPHLDDAVLSCGEMLAGATHPLVVTVFAGFPPDTVKVTPYDEACGFATSASAVVERRIEDAAAMKALGAESHLMPLLDGQYGSDRPTPTDLAMQLADAAAGARRLFVPLGIVHPDHELVAAAARVLVASGVRATVWLYEELPYRVVWPEEARTARDRWRDFPMELSPVAAGPVADKREAVACYASQVAQLARDGSDRCLFVPERYWRLG